MCVKYVNALLINPGRRSGGAIWAETGAGYGIEVRDPTLDQRVLTYCFSVPDWVYRGPDGSKRWLIRQAMHDLLPPQVRDNTRIGTQAADLLHRLRADADEMEAVLRQLEQSPLAREYLALERMREIWQTAQHQTDVPTQTAVGTILTRGMLAGLFLLELERGL